MVFFFLLFHIFFSFLFFPSQPPQSFLATMEEYIKEAPRVVTVPTVEPLVSATFYNVLDIYLFSHLLVLFIHLKQKERRISSQLRFGLGGSKWNELSCEMQQFYTMTAWQNVSVSSY